MDALPATIAAIDVGSNALRLAIGRVLDGHRLELIENIREPVRLGHDVFGNGAIGEQATGRAVEALEKFRRLMDKHGVTRSRAVGTSALREATNREIFLERVAETSGIEIRIIGGEEEARLVHLAVDEALNLKDKLALLVDIGGGSVEVTLVAEGSIVTTESFKMGAVRLLQELERKKRGERQFNQLVREYAGAVHKRVKKELGNGKIQLCVGTGGNVESLGDLRKQLYDKSNDALPREDLETLVKKLQDMTYERRVRELDLRPDRADVIVPAAIVLQNLVKLAGVQEVLVPHVGLKDGLLLDLVQELSEQAKRSHRDQVLASALQAGRRLSFDEQHGRQVAKFAAQLFDQTRAAHKLDEEYRVLLEIAALLHEVGNLVNVTGHHKHSYYLLINTPFIGLTEDQRAIVANVARYHRKTSPNLRHENYRALSAKDRVAVTKLAALLRLADALDTEYKAKVESISIELEKPHLTLRLKGEGDLLLERWALVKKAGLFEEVFGLQITVAE